jgi:hypothetical protein
MSKATLNQCSAFIATSTIYRPRYVIKCMPWKVNRLFANVFMGFVHSGISRYPFIAFRRWLPQENQSSGDLFWS